MTKREKQSRIIRLKDLIDMLEGDIDNFGGTPSDKNRLASYKKELKELTK